jgi:hypothetical protein
MKIIVSHDVDHIKASEHIVDNVLIKHLVRTLLEYASGTIGIRQVCKRLDRSFVKNKWQNIVELIDFEKSLGVRSTFFFGMANGLGMSYSVDSAKPFIEEVISSGFDVGVHGIATNNLEDFIKEFTRLNSLTGLDNFGIRQHYLNLKDSTLKLMNETGYSFDSSVYELSNPYKIGNMWEFPLHIMDGYLIYKGKSYLNYDISELKNKSVSIIERAEKLGIEYFTILFHDAYYCDSFPRWKEWYEWLIKYLYSNGYEFINYNGAIVELNTKYKKNEYSFN